MTAHVAGLSVPSYAALQTALIHSPVMRQVLFFFFFYLRVIHYPDSNRI
jgi:hypothetical protein